MRSRYILTLCWGVLFAGTLLAREDSKYGKLIQLCLEAIEATPPVAKTFPGPKDFDCRATLFSVSDGIFIIEISVRESKATLHWHRFEYGLKKPTDFEANVVKLVESREKILTSRHLETLRELMAKSAFFERPEIRPALEELDGIGLTLEVVNAKQHRLVGRNHLLGGRGGSAAVIPVQEANLTAFIYYIFGLSGIDAPIF